MQLLTGSCHGSRIMSQEAAMIHDAAVNVAIPKAASAGMRYASGWDAGGRAQGWFLDKRDKLGQIVGQHMRATLCICFMGNLKN